MRNRAVLSAGLLAIMMTACGSAEQPQVVEQIVVREPGEAAPAAAATSGDGALDLVALGEDAFQRCTGCHVVEAGAPSTSGPNLHGVVGRVAGSLDGYPYTDGLAAATMVWDEANLDAYLADPEGTVPGTEMAVGTVTDADTRAAIIAYLAAQSE